MSFHTRMNIKKDMFRHVNAHAALFYTLKALSEEQSEILLTLTVRLVWKLVSATE